MLGALASYLVTILSSLVDQIRAATNGNFLLGNARFAAEIEATLGRRVSPGTPGRPRKPLVPRSKDLF